MLGWREEWEKLQSELYHGSSQLGNIEVICCIVGWKTRAEAMQLSGILLQIKVEYLLNHFYLR